MTWFKDKVRQMMPRPAPPQPEKPTYEQMKEVIDLAEEFDRLQGMPVWEKVLRRMSAAMNAELLEAANKKYDREGRLMHCDMYEAKREILDDLQGWMEATQRERDRILEDFREMKYGGSGNNPGV